MECTSKGPAAGKSGHDRGGQSGAELVTHLAHLSPLLSPQLFEGSPSSLTDASMDSPKPTLNTTAAGPAVSEGSSRVVPLQWWTQAPQREVLLTLLKGDADCAFVYNLDVVRERALLLQEGVPPVGTWLYAVKANTHPSILQAVGEAGFGYECVSIGEIRFVLAHGSPGASIVFSPNFCARSEYIEAYALGESSGRRIEVIVDSFVTLLLRHTRGAAQGEFIFAGKEVAVRLDTNTGAGHHEKVITSVS